MSLFHILLCIVLVSPYSTTSGRNGEMIDAAVKALSTASAGSADVLLALSSLGPQAAFLMKVVIPIGAMVVETINPKPKSEEYEALIDLKKRTEVLWEIIQKQILLSTVKIAFDIEMLEYSEKVDTPIAVLRGMINTYLNPEKLKTDKFIFDLRTACTPLANTSPTAILSYLIVRLVDNCKQTITPSEALELADHRTILMRILLRLKVEQVPVPDIGLYLSEFSEIYKRINKNLLKNDLSVYHRNFVSYEKAVQAFFVELQNRSSIRKVQKNEMSSCSLRTLIEKSYFDYPQIVEFVRKLKNQLVDVTYYAGICAEVCYHGDDISMNTYTKSIVEDVTLISTFTSKWLNDSLISAWPSAHQQILNEQIAKNTDMNLENVADSTHKLLKNTGIPNYVYEIVIVKAAEKYEHYFQGINNYCSFKKEQSGYDTVIGRIALNSTDEQETFEVEGKILRKTNDMDEMNITIQYEMNELFDKDTVTEIADTLKKKIGKEFITEQDFHCWGIVRQWASHFWSSCPPMDYWSSSYRDGDLNSSITLRYTNRGGYTQDCEDFRFYFFN